MRAVTSDPFTPPNVQSIRLAALKDLNSLRTGHAESYMTTPQWHDFVQSVMRAKDQHDSNEMRAEWRESVLVGKTLKRQCKESDSDEQISAPRYQTVSSASNPHIRPEDAESNASSELSNRLLVAHDKLMLSAGSATMMTYRRVIPSCEPGGRLCCPYKLTIKRDLHLAMTE
ncbi:hypothetical protein HDU90_001263 [Geranomyces variabilis]|nr:hypothetical protein HDU90_001263 [Geranomyces variabilis]